MFLYFFTLFCFEYWLVITSTLIFLPTDQCETKKMASFGGSQVFILILCLSELLTVGMLIFSHGFLLTRQVVLFNSSCEDFKVVEDHVERKSKESINKVKDLPAECWMTPTFRRAVILIIDALRYDFAAYNHSLKVEEALHYQNKMPVFKNILQSKPRQAYLVPFFADAPTTTMQRLKGLTTGSLPTFIDASHNFARYFIWILYA